MTKAAAAGPLVGVLSLGVGAAGAEGQRACPGASTPVRAQGRAAAAGSMRCLVNAARARDHVRLLRPSRLLDVAATRHTRAMVRTGVISHRVPGEAPLRARVSVTGYFKRTRSIGAAEVLAWVSDGQATPQGLMTVLLGSPAHRAILLSSRFRDVGAGLAWIGGPVAGPGAGQAIITLNLGHASS